MTSEFKIKPKAPRTSSLGHYTPNVRVSNKALFHDRDYVGSIGWGHDSTALKSIIPKRAVLKE